MNYPLHAIAAARQHLIAELIALNGADMLNVQQYAHDLHGLGLEELTRLRDESLAELDERFTSK